MRAQFIVGIEDLTGRGVYAYQLHQMTSLLIDETDLCVVAELAEFRFINLD